MSTRCGDPRFIAESVPNAAIFFGLEYLLGVILLLYLVPLFLVGGVGSAVAYARSRLVLLRWPDVLLATIPAIVWVLLAISYPLGKPFVSVWELVPLGVFAACTILLRYGGIAPLRTEMAKTGLLGTTSLAICFWAFMPATSVIP